jgi:hypothetical protein
MTSRRDPLGLETVTIARHLRRSAFVLYCLVSGVLATTVGAVVSLVVDAGIRVLVWAVTTLALTAYAGLMWERVAPENR